MDNFFSTLRLGDSPDVIRLFSCFVLGGKGRGETLKAFIFSLKPSKPLPPFKCLVKDKRNAIQRSPNFGPWFGRQLFIHFRKQDSRAWIDTSYSVPFELNQQDRQNVLAKTDQPFAPDNYEVFYSV